MKFEVQFGDGPGGKRIVELDRTAHSMKIALDGNPVDADICEIAPNIFSILLRGQSHEIRITPTADGKLSLQCGTREFIAEVLDPRAWRGRRHSALEAQGRQQILAPMPGKIVRLLVKAGDPVQAGQAILVVEAMKMQNEIRSPKSGKVERLLVAEGQPVNVGQVLAWID